MSNRVKVEKEEEEKKKGIKLKKELEGLPSCLKVREVGKKRISFKELEQVLVVNVVKNGK